MAGKPSVRLVLEAVSAAFAVSVPDLISHKRDAETAIARHAACGLAYALTGQSLPQIARVLGGRDHTTVLHSVRKAAEIAQLSADFAALLGAAEATVGVLHQMSAGLSATAQQAIATINTRLADPDPAAIARDVLLGGYDAAMRLPAPHVLALAARVDAGTELVDHTTRLLILIDELALDLPSPLRRRELAREAKALIPQVTRCLREAGHLTETPHGETDDEAEDRRAELAGAADTR